MIGLRAAPARRQDPACRIAVGSPYRVQERRYGSSRSRFVGMYRSTRKGKLEWVQVMITERPSAARPLGGIADVSSGRSD